MNIMVLSDTESKSLWDYFEKEKLEGIDLILSCGDLKSQYLSFLSCFTKAPILYVHGNHDVRYEQAPPEGCTCIEDKIYTVNGIRILGLGGSMRYKPGDHQYTQREMKKRIQKPRITLRRHKESTTAKIFPIRDLKVLYSLWTNTPPNTSVMVTYT